MRALVVTLLLATTPALRAQEGPPMPTHVQDRNHLGAETSPYLLQHQHNPVHWWPWSDEAFERARDLDRPVFLSIGYSTCYWCHVMERESFEDEQTAAYMNEHFVCIKVDREERPDVDDAYMTAVQLLNEGQGGWPMSVFIEPYERRPFLGGTYFPPRPAFGRPSFAQVLEQVAEHWRLRRDQVLHQADHVAGAVARQHAVEGEPQALGRRDVERALSQLMSAYDRADGGFGRGPNKFPTPVNLDFLIAAGWDLPPVREAVVHTLDRMATGGMYDQVGGGFHRYSTDAEWLVPHFEKMLYDNGQLASTYAEAYARTSDPYYAEIVRETLDYVLREMTAERGAFHSAQDAEVNHLEGDNYVWTAEQVRRALEQRGRGGDVEFALDIYGLDEGPNFRDPHHPEVGPRNVLFLARRPDALAADLGTDLDDLEARLDRINIALLEQRNTREQPGTDDKILAGWNGLMIAGMADGGRALGEMTYVEAAARAAEFVLTIMRRDDGGLWRSHRAGASRIEAFLEDYAFMIRGLIALHRATGDGRWLDEATALATVARTEFGDEKRGGWYDARAGEGDLFVRVKSIHDGATPSGAATMICNLLELHALSGDEAPLNEALAALRAVSGRLAEHPTASVVSMQALARLVDEHADRLEDAERGGPARRRPVLAEVSARRVELPEGAAQQLDVTLTVAEGYHVNAHEPGIEHLVPLEIALVGGGGVEIDVTYPEGTRYDGPLGAMVVHHGAVTIPVTLRRAGALTGRPRLVLTYQVCTDRECLAPRTQELPVSIGEE